MTAQEAKDYLAGKIADAAKREGVGFDSLEKGMLYWSSEDEGQFVDLGHRFEQKHNDRDYEKKVKNLIKKAYRYDAENNPQDIKQYRQASNALCQEDNYLTVMLDPALGFKHQLSLLGVIGRTVVSMFAYQAVFFKVQVKRLLGLKD